MKDQAEKTTAGTELGITGKAVSKKKYRNV